MDRVNNFGEETANKHNNMNVQKYHSTIQTRQPPRQGKTD